MNEVKGPMDAIVAACNGEPAAYRVTLHDGTTMLTPSLHIAQAFEDSTFIPLYAAPAATMDPANAAWMAVLPFVPPENRDAAWCALAKAATPPAAPDEAMVRDAMRWQAVRNNANQGDWQRMAARCTTGLALDRYADSLIDAALTGDKA